MALLKRGAAPSGGVGRGNVEDFGLACHRHLAHAHFVVLAAVEVAVALLGHHGLGAYLQRDDVGFAVGRLLPFGEDVALPFLVGLAVKVGVGLVLHFVGRCHGRVGLGAVLGAGGGVAEAVFHGVGVFELLLQEVPRLGAVFEVERVRQEVVGGRVLVHAAHQIRHCVEEVFVAHHGRVENHVVAQNRLRAPHVVGHAFEHLEAEAVFGRAIFLRQQVSVGYGEQVVRGHADVQHLGVFGHQSALYQVQIVGVDLGLGAAHWVLPSAQAADHRFHLKVAALDYSHLDGRTAVGHAGFGKFEQFGLEVVGVGQIGLHHYAGFVVLELRQAQHVLEQAHREVRVLVFLHVEVDELGALAAVLVDVGEVDGLLVEFGHAAHQLGEALLVVERVRLGVDARNLDRDVVDVGAFEGLEVVVVALVGLAVAQHHFAQQVDVLAYLLLEAGGQVLGQARACLVDDDLGGVGAQAALDDGNGDGVEAVGEALVHLEEQGVALVEELRYSILVYEHLYPFCELLVITNL